MEKTKLGISVNLMAMVLYFSGLLSSTALFLAAGYILLREEDEWLRKAAVKAVVLVAVFAAGYALVSVFSNGFSAVESLVNGIPKLNFNVRVPLNLDSVLRKLLGIAENLVFFVLGLNALNKKSFSVGPVDSLVEKHS